MHTLMHLQQFQPWPIIETPETVGPIHFSLFCCRLERVGGGWRWQWERCADCCLHLAASVCSRCCLAAIAVTGSARSIGPMNEIRLSLRLRLRLLHFCLISPIAAHSHHYLHTRSITHATVHSLTPLCTSPPRPAADHVVVAAAALPLSVARARRR